MKFFQINLKQYIKQLKIRKKNIAKSLMSDDDKKRVTETYNELIAICQDKLAKQTEVKNPEIL